MFSALTTDLTLFQVSDTRALSEEGLKKNSFRPLDCVGAEKKSVGWVNIDNMTDPDFSHSTPYRGEWLCFAIRRDTRKVPELILNKHLDIELAKNPEELSHTKKLEVKRRLRKELMAQAEPVPLTVDVAVSLRNGLMMVSTNSRPMLQEVTKLFGRSFDVKFKRLLADCPVRQKFRTLFFSYLKGELDGEPYTLSFANQMTVMGRNGEKPYRITLRNDKKSGMKIMENMVEIEVIRTALVLGDIGPWIFDLKYIDGRFTIHNVKIPPFEIPKSQKNDPDAVLLGRLDHLELLVNVLKQEFNLL